MKFLLTLSLLANLVLAAAPMKKCESLKDALAPEGCGIFDKNRINIVYQNGKKICAGDWRCSNGSRVCGDHLLSSECERMGY